MGQKSDAGGSAQGNKLKQEPDPEENEGGEFDKMKEEKEGDQSQNPGPGKHEEIGPHNPGDGSAGPHHRYHRVGMEDDVGECRAHPAYQVKNQEFQVTEGIFNIIPEYPEKEHIDYEVKDAPVEEHGSEQRTKGAGTGPVNLNLLNTGPVAEKGAVANRNIMINGFPGGGVSNEVGDGTVFQNGAVQARGQLKDENQTVDNDQSDGEERNRPGGVDVLEGDHGSVSNYQLAINS